MKQSSIDWLIEKITDMVHESNHPELANLYEQAKAMHEQEIKDAFNMNTQCGIAIKPLDGVIKTFEAIDDEDYYNETFGGNK